LQRELPRNNLELLGITLEHAGAVEILPPHHKDPFDRILIAQAIGERVPIVSIDAQLDPYGITRIW
jgi:PIN domain nuclease of toxin-antitoxin system